MPPSNQGDPARSASARPWLARRRKTGWAPGPTRQAHLEWQAANTAQTSRSPLVFTGIARCPLPEVRGNGQRTVTAPSFLQLLIERQVPVIHFEHQQPQRRGVDPAAGLLT